MYYFVQVWDADAQHLCVGYVRTDGTRGSWANDCKFATREAAEKAKVAHVIVTARETPGRFPYSYTVEESKSCL